MSSAVAASNIQHKLLSAIRNGNVEEVKTFLAKGADANAQDKYEAQYDGDEDGHNQTPLHYAVLYRRVDDRTTKIIDMLISKGADVNSVDTDGATPLHYALRTSVERYEDRESIGNIVALFISKGANVNARHGMTGETPLHMAVENDYKASVELLLAKGADANAQNKYGQTSLFRSIDAGIAELLLKHGAKLSIKDKGGNTPLSFALSHNYQNLANVLRAHGATE